MRLLHGGDGSPFVRKVRIVLDEMGLPFERDTTLATDRPVESFSKLNPTLKVPVLEDDGVVVLESNLIIEYLLRTYPIPENQGDHSRLAPALTRPDHHWEDGKVLDTLRAMEDAAVFIRLLGVAGLASDSVPFLARQKARVSSCLDWLEAKVQSQAPEGFWPGHLSVADISLVCALDFAAKHQIYTWQDRASLKERVEQLYERPSVSATRAP
ncbi:MAG: glutathione S-transferase family protein [SAR324 cluster bacterium]|nr:glutathione S-transferase family protein [SAR324 cluster bacterium]